MSRRRLLSSLAAIAVALLATARLAVLSFPISAPAQTVVKGENGLLHRAPIDYPAEAIEKGIQGTVLVEATLNDRGAVTDARVLSGLEPLRKAALKSVLEWHYALPIQSPVQVAIDFTLPPNSRAPLGPSPSIVQPAGPLRLSRIVFGPLSTQVREAAQAKLPYRVGDELGTDSGPRIKQILRDIDEHLDYRVTNSFNEKNEPQGVVLQIFSTAPMELPASPNGSSRIRVGGNVQAAMVLNYVRPEYPALAKQARVQGVVRLAVIISKEGTMLDIKAESGHPLLVSAALDAVRQWTYKPTLLNGQPVEVATVVDVNFTLAE